MRGQVTGQKFFLVTRHLSPVTAFMLSKFKVLLVDDNADKRQLLTFALAAAGYSVHTATDGVEGLAAVETLQPDLIITDVMMPNMDGYEMARRVRANPATRFIPIIIQTSARG